MNLKLKKLIKEAVKNVLNDFSDEEILMNASPNDINFDGKQVGGLIYLNIYVNGKLLKINGLKMEAEEKSRIEPNSYQLHIKVPSMLRQKGIATKLYTAFLLKCGNIVSLFGNRVGEYAKENNMSVSHDTAIDKMLLTVAKNTNANIERLLSGDKEIGFILTLS